MGDPLRELAERVLRSFRSDPPHLVGISGAVSVGKSTVARELARGLAEHGLRATVVATDAFLHPNAVLDRRRLSLRKGFPESFDVDRLLRFVRDVRSGSARIEIPVYSHATYDIVPGKSVTLERPDVVIVEGVIALQPPVVDELDVPIYVEAEESDVRAWYVGRFLQLTRDAAGDPESFYRGFAHLGPGEVENLAEATWDSINAVNLREHILPSKSAAMFVVSKASDHTITAVLGPDG